ncbi:KpsF/GutQ family sugar-phosphate isomerase [bacterium]|jgi:arabinose-5-phosphate isomerase|nr:MAG: KpsF/GutQ family sugar-phosphate isomerase [bacterium]
MTKKEIIETGRDVLATESGAVASLSRNLGEEFVQAVNLLCRAKARVIVIGMGKSGLVGRKLAATLASCGTPAIFIHPAEAGHGDLGMILKEDIVIAISYSGETREVVGLLDFFKRIGVKLIAITGDRNSRIAKYSDIVLDARVEKEAGPGNIIPTASSTAALALGDALAIAAMKKKGFSEKDFAVVHPKGQAGRKLLRVESLMRRGSKIPFVRVTTPMKDAIQEMSVKKIGMTCVLDETGLLAGVITDGDLRRMLDRFRGNLFRKTAGDCMTPDPITIDKGDLATEALNIMEEKKITSLVIRNKEGRVDGIIHLHDLWRTEMF